jgi:hypothetical protein
VLVAASKQLSSQAASYQAGATVRLQISARNEAHRRSGPPKKRGTAVDSAHLEPL